MYPKNSASPPRLAVGAVVDISTGAVQTSGVTVSVIPQGGTEAAGLGTVAYSTGGIVEYTPTQAETNYDAFIVTAYKTSCLPAAITIVTTASAVAGYAALDWSLINAPTTSQNLSGTTISTSQAVASVSGAVGSVTGAVGSVTGNVGGNVAGSVASVTGAVGSVTGNVGGNVVGSVASVAGSVGSVTGNVGGNVVGSVASVTNPVAITSNIKANTTGQYLSFTMTDSTNHNPDPGLTVAGQVSINGTAFVSVTGTISAIGSGDYVLALSAADCNGKACLYRFTATGADDLNLLVITQP